MPLSGKLLSEGCKRMFSAEDSGCTRREFLRRGMEAVLAAGVGIGSARQPVASSSKASSEAWPIRPPVGRRRPSPNERIQVACIGLGQRGSQHLHGLESVPGAAVVALCDVDRRVLYRQAEEFRQRTGRAVRLEVDYRRLVEQPDIDAVAVATCNHTHAVIAAAALRAGKHVYVEKPCSHNLWEGEQLVRAAQKYGRICFHGVQARTSPAVQEAIERLQGGLIGQVRLARIRAIRAGPPPPPMPDEPTPPAVAYDLWLGPAAHRPFNRTRFHRDWRWWPEYGNGPLANQAFHLLDLARWGLAVDWPLRIRPVRNPPQQADTLLAGAGLEIWHVEFPAQKAIRVELWPASGWGASVGSASWGAETVTFYGTDGQMEVDCFGYRTWWADGREPGPRQEAPPQEFEEFIRAVHSGQIPPRGPDILQGHFSSGLLHLVNIARELGRTVRFDPARQSILTDSQAFPLARPEYRKPFLMPEIA